MIKYEHIAVLVAFTFFSGCAMLQKNPSILKPEMVFVEGGTFLMGDLIDSTNTDALPLHEVTLNDFYIGKYEVTFQQYDEFAASQGKELPRNDNYGRGSRAAVYVNWHDAKAFCEHFGWRLPTENEWEYAAREGGKKRLFSGTNSPDSLSDYAITNEGDISFAYQTGTKRPNDLGIHDMSGNVYEWIGAYYQFYENPDAWHDLEKSSIRIIRGGSFRDGTPMAKVYWRVGVLADIQDYDIGFRCAISQEELNKNGVFNGLLRFRNKQP